MQAPQGEEGTTLPTAAEANLPQWLRKIIQSPLVLYKGPYAGVISCLGGARRWWLCSSVAQQGLGCSSVVTKVFSAYLLFQSAFPLIFCITTALSSVVLAAKRLKPSLSTSKYFWAPAASATKVWMGLHRWGEEHHTRDEWEGWAWDPH